MFKNSLVPRKHLATVEVNSRHRQLTDFVDTFIISNMLNVFKVIYVKDCKNSAEWYKTIATHVGGLNSTRYLTYQVEVQTYTFSRLQQSYEKKIHHLDKVTGVNIVDTCFEKIAEVSKCDGLVISIKALDSSILTPSNYSCSYLFARM